MASSGTFGVGRRWKRVLKKIIFIAFCSMKVGNCETYDQILPKAGIGYSFAITYSMKEVKGVNIK